MGIFKKSKDEFEIEDEPSYAEPQHTASSEPAASSRSTSSGFSKPAPAQNYGIEDAIALMRKLPNVNSEITITVVKKTLESANIQVEQIISDAKRKETQIENRTSQLSQEINELQQRIAHLNDEITELTADLKETTKVKNLLVGTVEEDRPQPKAKIEAEKKPREDAPATNTVKTATGTTTPPKEPMAMADKG